MYHWYLVNPDYQTYLDRALQGRAEAQGRAAYLVIVGVEAGIGFIARAATAGLHRAARAIRLWNRRRQTFRALSKLDDRMLRDVGINPGEIAAVATALTEGPAATPVAPVPAAGPAAAPATPRLRLDLDCPDLRVAA